MVKNLIKKDMKHHLSTTDYKNFLQSVEQNNVLTSNLIVDKATEVLVKEFNDFRFNASDQLSEFLDFVM
jgi:vacuolar-type H+-ATPase subunit C/Vma6